MKRKGGGRHQSSAFECAGVVRPGRKEGSHLRWFGEPFTKRVGEGKGEKRNRPSITLPNGRRRGVAFQISGGGKEENAGRTSISTAARFTKGKRKGKRGGESAAGPTTVKNFFSISRGEKRGKEKWPVQWCSSRLARMVRPKKKGKGGGRKKAPTSPNSPGDHRGFDCLCLSKKRGEKKKGKQRAAARCRRSAPF